MNMKMNIIKLESVDSTNHYLKRLCNSEEKLPNFLTIWTPNQTNGVGQYGSKWFVEPYKNLTFSVLVCHKNFLIENYFWLNMIVSLAVNNVLESLKIPQISIKWPNDILSGKFKIGGILIENIIRNTKIEKSIIGIGLNVNQLNFNELYRASSLQKITKKEFNLEFLLKEILKQLQEQFSGIETSSFEKIYSLYERKLFQKDKVSAFRPKEGTDFSGIIRQVLPSGELVVEMENNQTKAYSLKEIQLLY